MAVTNISNQFSPRRGSKSRMNNTEYDQSKIVLAAGELFIEYPDTGVGTGACKVKIGDGVTQYYQLPYAIENDASGATIEFSEDTATTVDGALAHVVSGASNAVIVAGLKKAVSLLNGEVIKQIVFDGITVNPTNNVATFDSPDYSIDASVYNGYATVELEAETGYGKTNSSFLVTTNDHSLAIAALEGQSGFDISANPTGAISGIYATDLTGSRALVSTSAGKVDVSAVTATELGNLSGTTANIQTQLDSKQAEITGAASTVVSDDLTANRVVISTSAGKIAAAAIDVTTLDYLDGTTANIQTQLNGKSAVGHTHTEDDITGYIDVAKLYGGASSAGHKIDIALLPEGALEKLVIVADDTARFALTTDDVQIGDTVKVTATEKMYFVKDTAHLDSEAGYEVYTAGTATSVPWSGVTGKPTEFPPEAHTHTMSEITDLYGVFNGATSAAAGSVGFVPAPTTADTAKYLCGDGTWTAFTNATSAAAGLMSPDDKQAVDLVIAGIYDFGDETPATP